MSIEDNFSTMPLRFRVWDKKEKRFIAFDENYCFVRDEEDNLCFSDIDWYSKDLVEMDRDRFIISQDTGIKDKNGKSIYTGDILFYGKWYVEVKYKDGEVVGYNPAEDVYYVNLYNMQLRGNIWQNPELLEER